jgi:hypothetical protein
VVVTSPGADARLEVSCTRWSPRAELLDVGHVAQEHDTRRCVVAELLLVVAELVLAELHEVAVASPSGWRCTTRGGERLGVCCTRWRPARRCPARGERLVVVTSPSAPSCGTREVAVVADLVVAELVVVAELHEVAVVADLVVAELVVVAELHEERLAVHDTRR